MRKFLSRALIATALAALPSVALAQSFPGGGGISGISGTCPSSSSTATIAGGISPSARSPVTGASDTLLAADCGEITEYSGATATAVTVPQAGSAGFPATFFTTVFVPVGAATRTFTTTTSVFSNTGTSSFTLSAGQSAALWSDGVNWGVMVGAGAAGASGVQPIVPSTTKTQVYNLMSYAVVTVGAAVPTQNAILCTPFISPGGAAAHFDQLYISVTAGGTGPLAVAIYADALVSGKHQPGALEGASSAGFTLTSIAVPAAALGVSGTGISVAAGLNWICVADASSESALRYNVYPATYPGVSNLVGSATASYTTATIQINHLQSASANWTSTYSATWPSSLTAQAWVEVTSTTFPIMSAEVVSSP